MRKYEFIAGKTRSSLWFNGEDSLKVKVISYLCGPILGLLNMYAETSWRYRSSLCISCIKKWAKSQCGSCCTITVISMVVIILHLNFRIHIFSIYVLFPFFIAYILNYDYSLICILSVYYFYLCVWHILCIIFHLKRLRFSQCSYASRSYINCVCIFLVI